MAGLGETLRVERRRQQRTLADAAAETRVRESYLAALESEEYEVLGGDVYVRGFIRLYGRYLGLDEEELIERYRAEHGDAELSTIVPSTTLEEVMPPVGGIGLRSTPILAAVGVVLLLVALFIFGRSRSDADRADDAPGPAPTAVAGPSGEALDPLADPTPSEEPTIAPGQLAPPEDAEPLTRPITVEVLPLRAIRVRVLQGQPPVDATLTEGQGRIIQHDDLVVFQIGDATAADIRVNGLSMLDSLVDAGFEGRAIEISCRAGDVGCDVTDVNA